MEKYLPLHANTGRDAGRKPHGQGFPECPLVHQGADGNHFRSLLLITVTFFIAHLSSSLIKARMTRRESESSSMSILTTVIDLAIYMAGFLIILSSYGISISPLLTALGAGGLASALALQDTLSNLFSGITTIVPVRSIWGTISAFPVANRGGLSI